MSPGALLALRRRADASAGEVSPSVVPSSPPRPEGPALLEALRRQVEFYFSKENLATDQYLVSQMNAQHFVPISTILEVSHACCC